MSPIFSYPNLYLLVFLPAKSSRWLQLASSDAEVNRHKQTILEDAFLARKVRLAKWFTTLAPKTKAKIVKDVTQLVLARRTRMCNFLEYKDTKVVYRRYASLFFVCGIGPSDNELVTLEIIHRYVEVLDRYFGNVCELDLIFNFQKAYAILDELIIAGELQESSKKSVLRVVASADAIQEQENSEDTLAHLGSRSV